MSVNLPEVIADKYECTDVIGRGGMGTVYKAIQRPLGRVVAVKMLSEELASDIEFRARFQQEAEVVAHMSHPNIVAVYDIEPYNHTFCIIMEYVDGESLQAKIDRLLMLPEKQAVEYMVKVAGALDYAHERRVVHRDIKPDNILVTKDGQAKLTDFGIARFLESKFKTQTGISMGTPKFMSPEQVTGKNVDGQSDIYSLGVCLYYCLAGQTPFDADNPIAVATKHLYEQPSPPSQHNQTISPAVERVILKCLEKSKEARFKTGAQLAEALQEAVGSRTPIRLQAAGVPAGSTDPTRRISSRDSDGGISVPGASSSAPSESDHIETPRSGIRRMALAPTEIVSDGLAGSSTSRIRALTDTGVFEAVNQTARMATRTNFFRQWWPAMAALGVILAALLFAVATTGYDFLAGDRDNPTVVPTTAEDAAAEWTQSLKSAADLMSEGRPMAARDALIAFQTKRPGFRPDEVAFEIDRITASLPLNRPDSMALIAERRDVRGREFYKSPQTYQLAKAYLIAAGDLFRATRGVYNGDPLLELLERSLVSNAVRRPPDAETQAATLFEEAQARIANVRDDRTTVTETRLMEAISLVPENFAYWMALGDYYRQRGFLDDARVVYLYVDRTAPEGSDAKRLAGQAMRQLE